MFRQIEDFKKQWAYESKATEDFIRSLTPASLEQRIDPGGRTLGRVAWHITGTISEMLNRTGLNVAGPADHEPIPSDPAMIADQYAASSASLLNEISAKWNDSVLTQTDDMYGQQWQRGETLHILITHQAHHRGEMVVLARQAGIPLTLGVYGPTREAWAAMGMEAMA